LGAGDSLWQACVDQLAQELPEQQFNTWIKPLVAQVSDDLSRASAGGAERGRFAWAAFARGYRMGLMASSDNHVGMPGRSYPGDRQAHTPFKGGLCAIWSPALTRESLFAAIRERRCYGTTGARIIVRFSIDGKPMGSAVTLDSSTQALRAAVEVQGMDELKSVEVVTASRAIRELQLKRGESRVSATVELPAVPGGHYYLRVTQADGERAWTSPVFMDAANA